MSKIFNLIILDESGSMSQIREQALVGANKTIQSIRVAQQESPDDNQMITFVTFDSGGGRPDVRKLIDCRKIEQVPDLTWDQYSPKGCTPLYDAIGVSVKDLQPKVGEGDHVLVTIITDGYENDSHEFTSRDISRIVEEMKSKGWLFTYIGANQDAIEVAKTMNIKNAMNFVQDDAGTRAMFAKERRSRGRFMAAVHHANSFFAPSSKESQELRQKLADSDNFFADDDDKA